MTTDLIRNEVTYEIVDDRAAMAEPGNTDLSRTNGKRREVAVVTEASAGVGHAVVRRFAHEGAHVGLIALAIVRIVKR